MSGLPACMESTAGQVPYHMNIEIGVSGMFISASPLLFFSTMYFLLWHLCFREFVLSLLLPKRSILPYISYSSPCHNSSSSHASREHVRPCAKQALPKKPSSTEFGRTSLPPLSITWSSRLPSPDQQYSSCLT